MAHFVDKSQGVKYFNVVAAVLKSLSLGHLHLTWKQAPVNQIFGGL